ncbi:MAG: hypothetical protein OEZ47_07585 [Gammaproteobacteria bacterium]|nr:hypothetical protein [Gammaproteobacteria bacterium]
MNDVPDKMLRMLIPVAEALGEELLKEMAFVGGSTVAFLISDPITRQAVRFTLDVDVILHVEGQSDWYRIQDILRQKGFKEAIDEEVICRMKLGDILVDFMPDDEAILGFSSQWYQPALKTADVYPLTDKLSIKILTPVYFLATKLEAFLGRGKDNLLASQDLEDIINLVDGREELLSEVTDSEQSIRQYIAEQFWELSANPDFEYAVKGNIQEPGRVGLFFQRWESISNLGDRR